MAVELSGAILVVMAHTRTETLVAPVAALLADPARAAMLWALADGRALPAGELARVARVSASTASHHLAKLLDGGLVHDERHGRHRYFRLATPEVAAALEALAVVRQPHVSVARDDSAVFDPMRFARSCYDHLAGYAGVALTEALVGARSRMSGPPTAGPNAQGQRMCGPCTRPRR